LVRLLKRQSAGTFAYPTTTPPTSISIAIMVVRRNSYTTCIDQRALNRVLVAHAEAGAVCKHAGGDVHGEQFLEEEFCGVRDVDLGDTSFVVAGAAFVKAFLELAGVYISETS
jgi:hypothetical protein